MAKRFAKYLSVLAAAFVLSSVGMVIYYRLAPVRITPLMVIRKAEACRQGRTLSVRQQWVPIEDISPALIAAVVNSEDAHFYEHSGFDMEAIANAYHINRACGRIVMGGSTISQQTAKNVFCTPSRTYWRKALEVYFTVLIEFLWGKERIMEVYLNVIELGDGVFGVEAASQCYFQLPACSLSAENANRLCVMIPNPCSHQKRYMEVFTGNTTGCEGNRDIPALSPHTCITSRQGQQNHILITY